MYKLFIYNNIITTCHADEVLQVCVQMNRECVAITENPDDECIQRLISNDIPEHYTPPLLEPSQPPTPEKAIGKKSKKCNTKKGRPSDFHIDTQELLQKLSQLEKTDGKKNPLKKKGELSSRIITRSTAK